MAFPWITDADLAAQGVGEAVPAANAYLRAFGRERPAFMNLGGLPPLPVMQPYSQNWPHIARQEDMQGMLQPGADFAYQPLPSLNSSPIPSPNASYETSPRPSRAASPLPTLVDEDCELLENPPPAKKTRQSPTVLPRSSRQIVESKQLACMVFAYNVHFGEYSKGRKKVTQLVPAAVWKLVYQDFMFAHPIHTFQEETLKERLRDTLKEIKTGTSNEEGTEKATLQLDDVLEQIRSTDGHAARNVLRGRQVAIDRRSPGLGASGSNGTPPSCENLQPSSTTMPNSGTSHEKEKTPSKATIFHEQAKGINTMANSYKNGEPHREAFMTAKTKEAQAKLDSEAQKANFYSAKARSVKLADLFKVKDAGVYTEEEFRLETRKIMDS